MLKLVTFLGALALLGCEGSLTAGEFVPPAGDAPHAHHDHVYPATPGTPDLRLKSAEYPDARYRQARYYTSGRSRRVDMIVIHTTEGSYDGTIHWFQTPENRYRTSAHYVIRSADGQITQMVRESDTAHHVRNYNARSIGLEHEAFIGQARWYTDEMYRSSARLVRYLCSKHSIPCDRAHIKAHSELDPARRGDPGPHWDWDRYMAYVNAAEAPDAGGPDLDAPCHFETWTCSNDRRSRFQCAGGQVSATENCGGGCQVMPVGQHDVCRPGAERIWGACEANGVPGTCLDVDDCEGDSTPGFCPGARNIQCCTIAAAPAPLPPPAEDAPEVPDPGPPAAEEPDPAPEPAPAPGGPQWLIHARGLTLTGSEIPRRGLRNPTLHRTLQQWIEPIGEVTSYQGADFVSGTISHFGGPGDRWVTADETGAITGERLRALNDPMDPSPAQLQSRPEDFYYVAMRWDYSPNSRDFWRAQKILLVSAQTGRAVITRPVDWGPNTWTGRLVDVSPQTERDLGVGTDATVLVSFAAPDAPLGPVGAALDGGAAPDEPADEGEADPPPPPLPGEGGGCQVGGEWGYCIRTSWCPGVSTPGHCPGPNQVQCCTGT